MRSSRKFVKSGDGEKKNEKPEQQTNSIPYWKLFRFATRKDVCLIVLAIICATIAGLGLPYGLVMYGEVSEII